jgi:hypothetical protein
VCFAFQQRLQRGNEACAAAAERKACLEILRYDIVEHDDIARLDAVADCFPRERVVDSA